MVELRRICRRNYAAFDGEGTRRAGSRWTLRGTPVVYASATLSLAALEYFVHVKGRNVPHDLVATPITVPDGAMAQLLDEDLPKGWRTMPASEATQVLGSSWAHDKQTAVLSVPSAIIPEERNYLLNPLHDDFGNLVIGDPRPFSFDPRMWK